MYTAVDHSRSEAYVDDETGDIVDEGKDNLLDDDRSSKFLM